MAEIDDDGQIAADCVMATLDQEPVTSIIAAYRERCVRAARDKRDAEWREAAADSFEDVQSTDALLRVFPALPEAVIHEIWKRDPRVQAARDAVARQAFAAVCPECAKGRELVRRDGRVGHPGGGPTTFCRAWDFGLISALDPEGRLAGEKGDANAD